MPGLHPPAAAAEPPRVGAASGGSGGRFALSFSAAAARWDPPAHGLSKVPNCCQREGLCVFGSCAARLPTPRGGGGGGGGG